MTFQEFDMIRLTADVTQRWHNLALTIAQERTWSAGTIGAIVHIHDAGAAYEVEFDADTATVRADQLEAHPTQKMVAEEFAQMIDDHRGAPILVELPQAWKFENDHGTVLARPAGFVAWMRDELQHSWRYTDDGLDLLIDDLQDATLFKLRWLG